MQFLHRQNRYFSCEICEESLDSEVNLELHRRMLHKNARGRVQCPLCGFATNRRLEFILHLESRHCKERCLGCKGQKPHLGRLRMKEHVRQSHLGPPLGLVSPCGVCNSVLRCPQRLLKHFLDNHVSRKCVICDQDLKCDGSEQQRDDIFTHFTKNHGKSPTKRPLPLSERPVNVISAITDNDDAIQGLFSGSGPKKVKTPADEVIVVDGEDDVKRKPEANFFPCSECQYSSSNRSNLVRHFESTHLTYRCRVCRAQFLTRGSIVKHVRKDHGKTGEEDLRYGIADCLNPAQLDALEKIKTLEKSPKQKIFKCGVCGLKFKALLAWLSHSHECSQAEQLRDSSNFDEDIEESDNPDRELKEFEFTTKESGSGSDTDSAPETFDTSCTPLNKREQGDIDKAFKRERELILEALQKTEEAYLGEISPEEWKLKYDRVFEQTIDKFLNKSGDKVLVQGVIDPVADFEYESLNERYQ